MRSNNLPLYLSYVTAAVLALLPFHAFLTVWAAGGIGHYTLLRLWSEFLVCLISLGSIYLLVRDKKLRQAFLAFRPARWIGLYVLVLLVSGLVALTTHHVAGKALLYGWLADLRYLVFFLAVWVLGAKSNWLREHWRALVLGPAIVVAVSAVLQYWFLPYDFLKHFGYGDKTIPAYETINHNLHHLRVASTLRGANPLGAYLLLPISALAALLISNKKGRWNGLMFGAGLLLALAFSFSRSAWIGTALSLLAIGWLGLKNWQLKKYLLWGLAGLAVIGIGLTIALRNNTSFENTFLHTEHNSAVQHSSNEQHGAAFKAAAKDIIHQPLGGGVGTAGPQSVYNNHPARISENYFLQIGQEAGLIGLALFITICVSVGRQLWQRRSDSLNLWLVASLIGITFINLLSHAWSDVTLAYLWWGLAGIAIGSKLSNNKLKY